MVGVELEEREGFELMGHTKAMTRNIKFSKRLLDTPKQWNAVQDYWEAPKHDYEGGNRTLWAWYNSFTVDMKELKPELQLAQHASIHSVTKGELAQRRAKSYAEHGNEADFNGTVNRLLDREE